MLKISYDADNETHAGEVSVDIFEDLSLIFLQAVVKSGSQKFVDQTINFCKWMENPRTNYIINIFKRNYDRYNKKLLECPIKKGFYVAAGPRERLTNAAGVFPSFLPIKGNITVLQILRAKVGKTMQHLTRTTNVYELG